MAARLSPPWPSLLLVGPTGSGKSPLGDEMERRGFQDRRCHHFDFGANLRALAAASEGESGLSIGELAAVRASLATGALFEDRDMPMIIKILCRFAETRLLESDALLVLNGLPRHRSQAEAVDPVVAVERVISLEASAAVIRQRIGQDPGRDRAGRFDDDLEAVVRRLAIFRERTAPLLDYYRRRGVPISTIAVTAVMTAAEMSDELVRTIGEEERKGRA